MQLLPSCLVNRNESGIGNHEDELVELAALLSCLLALTLLTFLHKGPASSSSQLFRLGEEARNSLLPEEARISLLPYVIKLHIIPWCISDGYFRRTIIFFSFAIFSFFNKLPKLVIGIARKLIEQQMYRRECKSDYGPSELNFQIQ